MFNEHWYHSILRKYVVYFGSLFNNLYVERIMPDDTVAASIKVPLIYAKLEKVLVRLQGDPLLDRQAAIVLPAMAFEITGMEYDGTRALPVVNKIVRRDSDLNKFKVQYVPAPYNIDFKLYILVKNMEDGTKIIEQILPNFRPECNQTLEMIPEMEVFQDVPIVLRGVDFQDVYDEKYTVRRTIMWTLSFTLKGYFYGPVKKNPVIKFANTTFYVPAGDAQEAADDIENADPFLRVTVQPGLTANGAPTTNAAASVPWSTISVDDDYGFAETKTNIL